MFIQKIFVGKFKIVFRLPKQTNFNSGWVYLDKTKWNVQFETISPSIRIKQDKKIERHFFIRQGRVEFCADDPISPNKSFDLCRIRFSSIQHMVKQLDKEKNTEIPDYLTLSEDY